MQNNKSYHYNYLTEYADTIHRYIKIGTGVFVFITEYDEDIDSLITHMMNFDYIHKDKIAEIKRTFTFDNPDGRTEVYIYSDTENFSTKQEDYNRVESSKELNTMREQPKNYNLSLPYLIEIMAGTASNPKYQNKTPNFLLIRNIDRYFTVTAAEDLKKDKMTEDIASVLVRLSKARAADNIDFTVFCTVGDIKNLPVSVLPYVNVQHIPLPDDSARKNFIREQLDNTKFGNIPVVPDKEKELTQSFSEFRFFEIEKIIKNAVESVQTPDKLFEKDFLLNNINNEKKNVLEKKGKLEWIANNDEPFAGMIKCTKWLERKVKVYKNLNSAKNSEVPVPKGMLLLGLPGSGKSLMAMHAKRKFNLPLLKMDVGKLMGKHVGESENNLSEAINLAEKMSPCILWIDELEKAFPGTGAGSSHEVTLRMVGTLLTWLQSKKAPCFIIATANRIDGMPPEFFRAGRFDERFYTFMPDEDECKKIFISHIKKKQKIPKAAEHDANEKLDKYMGEVLAHAAEQEKFMNGADIAALVGNAYELLFIEELDKIEKSNSNESINAKKFKLEDIKEKIKESLNDTRVYGETDMKNIAMTWIRLNDHNFKSAVGNELIPLRKTKTYEDLKKLHDQISGTSYNERLKKSILSEILKIKSEKND